MKNYVTLCLLSFICAFSISSLSAQDKKETKKVIIVEEKQDADGNVTKTRIVKEGKDADLVLWSDNPLSVYAKAEKTLIEGTTYFDLEKDKEKRKEQQTASFWHHSRRD